MGVLGSQEISPVIGAIHQAQVGDLNATGLGKVFAAPEEADVVGPEHVKGRTVGGGLVGKVFVVDYVLALHSSQPSQTHVGLERVQAMGLTISID